MAVEGGLKGCGRKKMVHISAAGGRWTPMLLSAHHKGLRSKAVRISCRHAARSSVGLRGAPVHNGRRGSQLFATRVLSCAVCRASSLRALRIQRRRSKRCGRVLLPLPVQLTQLCIRLHRRCDKPTTANQSNSGWQECWRTTPHAQRFTNGTNRSETFQPPQQKASRADFLSSQIDRQRISLTS